MNAKKAKEKDRRRARKLAEEAWEAAEAENLDLAEKLILRAVDTQIDNPVLYNDQGLILLLREEPGRAEEAFRLALRLAPTYAEPYARLADLRARQGWLQEAIKLMEQAVLHAPDSMPYAERLDGYRAQLGIQSTVTVPPVVPAANTAAQTPENDSGKDWSPLVTLDWQRLGDRLTSEGCVLLPALLEAATCAELRALFDDDLLFANTVVMDRENFGQGVYRYFGAPIPLVVDELRRAVYPHVAQIANDWQQLLNEPERFPADWEGFRERCREAGQTTPTPILLKYGPGGYNALHRDLRGSVYFPIQMAVVLSERTDSADPASAGFRGGEFLLCDAPAGKKGRRRAVPAGLGDAVLFCTRDRLVRIGGVYGLQPVKHGVAPITDGTRLVLGVPFHEYR